MVIANPLRVKAIAHAHVKTEKVDAATLASLHAAGDLPEIWTPDAATERMRRLVARRDQVVRHRTRIKNAVHAILQAHLIPKCPRADLFNKRGRDWLNRQPVPEDERAAIARHVRALNRLGEDLAVLGRDIAKDAIDDEAIQRLLTITGVNLTVAAGLMAAIGSIDRFNSPQKLVSYFGLNPRVRQSGLGSGESTSATAGFLHPHPSAPWSSDRRRRGRTQARHPVLAHADEGRGLSLGPAKPGRPQAPRHGTGCRPATDEGEKARRELRLQHDGTAPAGGTDRGARGKEL
ncbi:transposase [Roseisalinus antarcticus]|uniref:transposase n=1 Tax=Roseisalinus antarcticus TaxID=254357 RepID=UPI00190E867D|nr:transposase [Roseisalinus antarcticus]